MRYDHIVVRESVGDKPVVCHLEKSRYRRRFVILTGRPCANSGEGGKNLIVGWKKEGLSLSVGPIREVITAAIKFIANLFNTRDDVHSVLRN